MPVCFQEDAAPAMLMCCTFGGKTLRLPVFFLLGCIVVTSAVAQQTPKSSELVLPYTPSLDTSSMDKTIDPCGDFYSYSCGGWQKKNPIPADQTSWSVYGKLYEDNLTYLRGILVEDAKAKNRGSIEQKIGDFYGACMEEGEVNAAGAKPMQAELDSVAALKSTKDIAALLAKLHLAGDSALFGAGSMQDPDNSESMIVGLEQGGLGLPDRDYYLNDDQKSKDDRAKYLEHVQTVFTLIGESPEMAKQHADTVMKIETELAKNSLTRVDRRDPYKIKNRMTPAELAALAPNFDWNAYFAAAAVPKFDMLNVNSKVFFKDVSDQVGSVPLADWKTYLRFHIANSRSPYLSKAFVDENFAFYRAYLRGAKEQQPRWKRCVEWTDQLLGEALGQEYVKKTFSPELKASTLDMTRRIEDAMAERIQQLDWMSPATKQQAVLKLKSIRNKVGYPDKWRDYSSVTIKPNDFYGDVTRAIQFESHRDFNKVSKPVDRAEWGMSPPTVNAYYNPQMNDINFPAGVLQPPLYDAKLDDAPNYGNTGSTIGHELTHGFDDEGRQFDAQGNLKDWWTKEDADQFVKRADCVVEQYVKYVVVDDIHINSKLTEGEDVADFGGTILAYMAWKDATKDKKLEDRDSLTPDQRFFVGLAQWACENNRPENLRVNAKTDPHSPGKYRINGVVVNMPEFGKAFSCKQGQPMAKPAEQVCHVW
jgi:endothelin-converting enzyme/putative endopeptidase